MTQITEFSLPKENYLEYLKLLREYGYHTAQGYATLVTSDEYLNCQPKSAPRVRSRRG
ncbi:MAG: hypothetical protein IM596_07945 [Pseudanabaena sp. M051S1SP2A07QC]|nr:hypothetical protein [Pseudanabaena sp. M051S1SP2A07QC]